MSKQKKNKSQESLSSIGYTGNVTVKVIGKTGKINKQYKGKNAGKLPLFKYLAYALCGNYESQSCPIFIATYDNDDRPTCINPILKSQTSITTSTSNGVEMASALLTFIIPGVTFLSGSETKKVRLFDGENYSTYNSSTEKVSSAEYVLDTGVSIDSDENLLVVWQLNISNNASQVSNNAS